MSRIPVAGVDLGGTKIDAALVKDGKILARKTVRTLADQGEKAVVGQLFSSLDALRKISRFSAIGIGSPGPLDLEKGLILNSPNLPFRNFPLVKIMKKRYGVPVRLDNDANCFALGEARFGRGRGYKSVVGIILGTGVGGGLVVDGRIFHGRGNAAEFGHMSISTRPRCTCGNLGCLEEYASARAVVRFAGEMGIQVANSHQLYTLAAGSGREAKLARKVFEEMGEMLGIGMTNVIHAVDPEIIVFGGGLSRASRLFMPVMRQTVKDRCIVTSPRFAVTRGNMELLGAASLVL